MEQIVILGGIAIISGVSLLLMDNDKTKKRSPTPKKRSPTPKKRSPEKTPLPTIRKTIKKSVKRTVTPRREPVSPRREVQPIRRTRERPIRETSKLVAEIPTIIKRPVQETSRPKESIQLRRAPSRSLSRRRSPSRSSSPKRSILKTPSISPRRVYASSTPTPPPLNIPKSEFRRSVSTTSANIGSDRGEDPYYREATQLLTDKEWEEANLFPYTPPPTRRSRRRSNSEEI